MYDNIRKIMSYIKFLPPSFDIYQRGIRSQYGYANIATVKGDLYTERTRCCGGQSGKVVG